MNNENKPSLVSLVGAGPGDTGLLTVRGREILSRADVVVYDRLIGAELLELARADALKIFVGKAAGQHSKPQDEINLLLVEHAKAGKSVCRLKGGDPFVFGRGGEEALFCRAHGIAFEIVPGVSSAIAAPAYAGIPVTHRDVATSFAVVTGHTKDEDAPPTLPVADTIVCLMGVRALPKIVAQLIERGESPQTPIALIRWGTTSRQQVVVGTLATIEAEVEAAKLQTPALIVIGEAVKLRDELKWFDDAQSRPLWGQTVIVTRAREQASSLVASLQELGAQVLQCPAIRIEELDDLTALDLALSVLEFYDWIVFSSANGVQKFWQRLRARGFDARALSANQIAAIGPPTAQELERCGLAADFVPESSISENVAQGLIERGAGKQKILVIRALEGRDVLEQTLRDAGHEVVVAPVYRTVPDTGNVEAARELLQNGAVNWITFSSSSTVRNFVEAIGAEPIQAARASFKIACIGPITAQTARDMGFEPDAIAESASVEALVEVMKQSYRDSAGRLDDGSIA